MTIVLVSHAHDAIRDHCRRVIWFDHGKLVADGAGEAEIARYVDWTVGKDLEQRAADAAGQVAARRWGSGEIEVTGVRFSGADGEAPLYFETGDAMFVHIDFRVNGAISGPLRRSASPSIARTACTSPGRTRALIGLRCPRCAARATVTYRIPYLTLLDGVYQISVAAHHRDDIPMYDYHDRLAPSASTIVRVGCANATAS